MDGYEILRNYSIKRNQKISENYSLLGTIREKNGITTNFILKNPDIMQVKFYGKFYNELPINDIGYSYDINTPWLRYWDSDYRLYINSPTSYECKKVEAGLVKTIPALLDTTLRMDELFEDDSLKGMILKHSGYETGLIYKKIVDRKIVYKVNNGECIGVYTLYDNEFSKSKILVMDDGNDDLSGGTVTVFNIKKSVGAPMLTYKYEFNSEDNNMLAEYIVTEINGIPSMPIDYPNIYTTTNLRKVESKFATLYFYIPTIRYIEDWDLPLENLVYEDVIVNAGKPDEEFIRNVYSMDYETFMKVDDIFL